MVLWKFLIGLIYSQVKTHEQKEIFNKTLINSFHNLISNKIILCGDKDPPWIIDETKT